jgi:hypothetical protein
MQMSPTTNIHMTHKNIEDRRAQKAKEYAKKRVKFDLLKEGKPCADCGASYPPYVMDWDHRDKGQKCFGIAAALGSNTPWPAVLLEVAKCDLVCANCHRIRTWAQGHSKWRDLAAPSGPRTHCLHGHELTPENTERRKNGRRECRICVRGRERLRGEARKVERKECPPPAYVPPTHCKRGHLRLPENQYGNSTCKLCVQERRETINTARRVRRARCRPKPVF